MLYKKKAEKTLSDSLFRNPTAEYRATPFWAWNDTLEKDEMLRQIGEMQEMGFGGFHMHTRCGLATPYLGEEFMDLIRSCNDEAKKRQMLAWLYDEDRWPSGAAGGFVTREPRYRQKNLIFTVRPRPEVGPEGWSAYVTEGAAADPACVIGEASGYLQGKTYLLAVFDVCLNANGTLASYSLIAPDATARGTKWYAYVTTSESAGWYNGQAYADTLSEETIDRFIHLTYDAYEREVGKDFGGSVPAIFTDEPQFAGMQVLPFAESKNDVRLPWTTDLPASYRAAYAADLVPHLPELLWDLPDGAPSLTRYRFHDHVCERFARAFADRCGKWCADHGLHLTGHMNEEPTLHSQSACLGEAMRAYRGFSLPGIDMLCNRLELSTAKQAQSAVHQYGREGMLSELYGVTGWFFDFRGHKYQGDWQAALGVTVRVPHLAWYSMKGSAKRDYPGSIHYQAAWYKEYKYIEDHYARLATALTRGKPAVRVAVVHPIESYWLAYGPSDSTADARTELEERFSSVLNWLLRGTVDFDFISESLLPAQYKPGTGKTLSVGEMAYDAVVVPGVTTLRASTLAALEEFAARGGKVIFMGECPRYVDAAVSDAARGLYGRAVRVDFSSASLLGALADERDVEVRLDNGHSAGSFVYNMRNDTDCDWLFLATLNNPDPRDCDPCNTVIYLRGAVVPTLYDTLSGEHYPLSYRIRDGRTEVKHTFWPGDSLLLRLTPAAADDTGVTLPTPPPYAKVREIDFKGAVPYTRTEPNVVLLDMPEWSEDGVTYQPREEILRIDGILRKKYSYPLANGRDVQPWVIGETKPGHSIYLRFRFNSTAALPVKLAFEELEGLWLNGKELSYAREGYFTDRHIYTTSLPDLQVGENLLTVRVPFGKRASLESLFLLGDFDVRLVGCDVTVMPPSGTVGFGSVVGQGLPFYGAGISYRLPVTCDATSDLVINASYYAGALITARLDGKPVGRIVFGPYLLTVPDVPAGEHTLELTLYASRHNCFGSLHNCSSDTWTGPFHWYSDGYRWTYEYQLRPVGILRSPIIRICEK